MGWKNLLCRDYPTNTGINMGYARRKGDLILGGMAEREGLGEKHLEVNLSICFDLFLMYQRPVRKCPK